MGESSLRRVARRQRSVLSLIFVSSLRRVIVIDLQDTNLGDDGAKLLGDALRAAGTSSHIVEEQCRAAYERVYGKDRSSKARSPSPLSPVPTDRNGAVSPVRLLLSTMLSLFLISLGIMCDDIVYFLTFFLFNVG